jgi:transcriptional regulator with XRE-family HTH domain
MYLNKTEKLPQPSETLDSYIKRLRLLLHLSQQELATKADVHLQSLGKLERGGKTTIKRFGDYVIDMETLPRALDEIMSLVF